MIFSYEYDDHYFLTDPKEFIYEFFPLQSEWQLLKTTITLKEFEDLPFVRSLFFRYGLYFPDENTKAVMVTDLTGLFFYLSSVLFFCLWKSICPLNCNRTKSLTVIRFVPLTGAVTIRIGMPSNMQASLIFHYNLKFYDNDTDTFESISLKRFVMQVFIIPFLFSKKNNHGLDLNNVTFQIWNQSVVGNVVAFRVHAPCSGAFLLDIFANAVTPREYLTGEPMKFKSVCKFKIVCEDLQTVMVPLPDCASGEWGPMKATRLFGLVPITHQDALIFAGRELECQFRMSRPLTDFMATLHKNGSEEKRLAKYATHYVSDDLVTFKITFPEEGQYGMDIYTREVNSMGNSSGNNAEHSNEKHLLTHCCKYLINSSKRNQV